MPMAAYQRRKLLNGTAKLESCSSEISRTRRKHARPTEDCFNTKSHATLEWDSTKKHVIAIKEQIAISWRNLRPFFYSLPHGCEILADTIDIPGEIFELNNLEEVLSQEVWKSCLSENERKYLMQFLPVEAEVQQIVKPLFAGDNFHFGNPLLKWGSTLRSGNMHPDAVVAREHKLKTEKKAYYSDLQKYHTDIIECLLKLRESWESCDEPEGISGKIWRKDGRRKFSSSSNGFVVEEGVSASSKSSSWAADERTDNHQSGVSRRENSHQSVNHKYHKKDRVQTLSSIDDGRDMDLTPVNGKKMQRTDALCNVGAKYMSYIKISKKQHEIVKNMEMSGDSIHFKSLGPLLGDLQNYHIQPYKVFLEEERKKLNEHWLAVAKDLPSMYASWRDHQLNKHQIIMSLKQELEEKLDSPMKEIEEVSVAKFSDQNHEEGCENSSDGKQDIEESVLRFQVDRNDDDDGTCGLVVDTVDEEHERGFSYCQSVQETITQNHDEVVANSKDPIFTSSVDPRGFFTKKNSSITIENTNSVGDPGSDIDSMFQDSRNNFLCNPRVLPSHDQLQKEVSSLGGSYSSAFDCLDFEFRNDQITSKPESAPQLEEVSPFSATVGYTNIRNGHGVALISGDLETPKNQITFRSEESPQPHVSAYSPKLGTSNMIISCEVPLASSCLELQRNQITIKPEDDARKPEDLSVYLAASGPTNMITSHGGPLASSGLEAQGNQITLKSLDGRKPEDVSACSTRLGHANMMNNHGVRHISESDIWQPASVLSSSYGSTAGAEHQGQWNGVKSSLHTQAEVLHRQIDQGSFKSYPEQDQNDLLQSILQGKGHGQGVISYNHGQKYASLNFEPSNNVLLENNRLPVHFHEQPSLPLSMEQGHEAGDAGYIQQNAGDNVISNLGGFPLQRQEQLLPPNVQDWPVRFHESLLCSIPSSDLSSQSWFAGERYVCGGWTASDSNSTVSQSLGNVDQSMYSVLPPRNQLRPITSYDSINTTDQFIPARNYGMMGSGIVNVRPHLDQSLDYMNRHDTTNAHISNDTGWMNLPQQNTGLNDPMGKPFMGQWNQ